MEFVIIFGVTLICVGLIGAISALSKAEKYRSIANKYSVKNSVKILDHKLIESESGRTITGHVQNTCDLRHGQVKVHFNFYNSEGVLIGNDSASINNLMPGDVWEFNVPVTSAETAEYKIGNIERL